MLPTVLRGPILGFLIAITVWTATAATPPELRITVAAGAVRLEWSPAEPGSRYTLESSPTLSPAIWRPLGDPGTGPSTNHSWTGPLPATGQAFFRLVLTTASDRGTLETNLLLQTFTREAIAARLAQYGLPLATTYGAEAWRVVYATVDAHGEPTRASALVVLPLGVGQPLPLASYQHGTVTRREDVPSRLNDEANLGLVLATTGYAAVLPDYLGLGASPGFHPYHHARSEATAVVDALRAGRELASRREIPLNGQLFLTGYSQGGHATLAAQRDLELLHSDEFTITASAPGAGAYDLSGTTADYFLTTDTLPSPYYFPYLLAAYVEVYGLAPSLADLLRPPFDQTLPPLLDGNHGGGEIDAALPTRVVDVLKPEELAGFIQDPEHPLRRALRDNDLYRDWAPQVPTRFYHCRGDADVPFANSQVARDAFQAAGAPAVDLIDPFPSADHGSCAILSLLGTKIWFDSIRQ